MLARSIAFAFGLGMAVAIPAAAQDVAIHPYASAQNYCPEGLSPVSINGVICCGTPNQSTSYQDMIRHPAPKTHVRRASFKPTRRTRVVCPIGVKGCFTE